MSKKVIWVWSFNNRQQTVGSIIGLNATIRPNKFQKGLKQALAPEWEVDFISDDLSENLPAADVIVIPKAAKEFYTERAKNMNVVMISGTEVIENDFEGIKKKIIEA